MEQILGRMKLRCGTSEILEKKVRGAYGHEIFFFFPSLK
jgi:hypothetical protein